MYTVRVVLSSRILVAARRQAGGSAVVEPASTLRASTGSGSATPAPALSIADWVAVKYAAHPLDREQHLGLTD